MKNSCKGVLQQMMITDSYDMRRYLAIFFMAGGAMAMTVMVGAIVYLLSNHAVFLFWIAVGLLILIGLMQTGFVALLAKRDILISKDRIEVKNKDASIES